QGAGRRVPPGAGRVVPPLGAGVGVPAVAAGGGLLGRDGEGLSGVGCATARADAPVNAGAGEGARGAVEWRRAGTTVCACRWAGAGRRWRCAGGVGRGWWAGVTGDGAGRVGAWRAIGR